jgi:hypothetical protein
MNETRRPRRIPRSIWAMFAGFLVGAALSLGTDEIMHVLKIYPPWGERMSDGLFILATAYRVAYSILGAYLVARLAPDRPMWHAMVLGSIGFVLSVAGAIATWNRDLGPHWYAVVIAAIALPCSWLGAKLFISKNASAVSQKSVASGA